MLKLIIILKIYIYDKLNNYLVKKAANVEQKATLPLHETPLATETIFYSSIKHSIYISGWALKKYSAKVEFFKSASNTTNVLF